MAQTIGGRIREFRKQRGHKQSELAALVGISPTYLNLIEHDKRAVAGKLLSLFANILQVERTQLLRGATAEIIEQLQQAARQMPLSETTPSAELDDIELFTTRFPGWANVLSYQAATQKRLESMIEGLSDRLSHDPVLSETIHIMLSNITAIRSISELLVVRGSMDEERQKSFIQNIFLESKRLSVSAEKLLEQFEPAAHSLTDKANDKEAFIPSEKSPKKTDKPAGQKELTLPETVTNTTDFVTSQRLITAETLAKSAASHHYHPFLIADYFDLPARAVFYQLLALSNQGHLPEFGLLEVDNAGGVLFRKETSTMRLPSRSGACPRWPVYRALGLAGEPVIQKMQFITGETYQAYAISSTRKRDFAQLVPVSQSVMLFHEIARDDPLHATTPLTDVGFHCSVCRHTNCPDRREVYALFDE